MPDEIQPVKTRGAKSTVKGAMGNTPIGEKTQGERGLKSGFFKRSGEHVTIIIVISELGDYSYYYAGSCMTIIILEL